jgi:GntR family transcriptional regulator/MocR family aminotransferase
MVLPAEMMERFREKLGFYSCTVSSFEQYTLARFLSQGHFEKHINRMRKFYRARRNRVLEILMNSPYASKMTIREEDAGLHFLVRLDTQLSDEDLVARCAGAGIRVKALSRYYHTPVPESDRHTLVVNYGTLQEAALQAALQRISGGAYDTDSTL